MLKVGSAHGMGSSRLSIHSSIGIQNLLNSWEDLGKDGRINNVLFSTMVNVVIKVK
jgi:hypothetical protein